MVENKIELKSVEELLGMRFFIPSYQRGYRWAEVQVLDLLNDLDHFISSHQDGQSDFYCLQPLVVKETVPDIDEFIKALPQKGAPNALECTRFAISNNTIWEVIDGQQRLTTLYIILSYLSSQVDSGKVCFDKNQLYSIEYQTRKDSKTFLQEITNHADVPNEQSTIDFSFMTLAYETVKEWFDIEKKSFQDKSLFVSVILQKVQFIWYETTERPTTVFKRLNIGKISLTNAELIKALFLNKSLYIGCESRKMIIANQWDEFEIRLQNDEFWLFLHDLNYDKPTRMEFIFDIMCEMSVLDQLIEFKKDKTKVIGADRYKTFRYFNAFFESEKALKAAGEKRLSLIELCWIEVKEIFRIFEEWYTSLELYHYVGFLVASGTRIIDILKTWKDSMGKDVFVNQIISLIKEKISNCKDLDKQYEIGDNDPKTVCRPLLLLHNIQTIINQNRSFIEREDYKLGVFYKFPFHLFKKENWNVEHIDSNTTNSLDTDTEKEKWLKVSWYFLPKEHSCRGQIIEYLSSKDDNKDFDKLQNEILLYFNSKGNLSQQDKNKIGNFVLLDEHTNKSYGNAIFPMKKMVISGKDHGIKYDIKPTKNDSDGKLNGFEIIPDNEVKSYKTAFVPPITKSAFLKEYNPLSVNPYTWDQHDANAYRNNIETTLEKFIK